MKTSVVICTKNNPDLVSTCMDTIIKQTIPPFELLIVDASTEDDTKNVVNQHSKTAPFPCIYIKQNHGYLTHARNIAIKRIRGDIVTFLDDDAKLHNEYLEKIIYIFENDKKGIIGGVQGFVTNGKKKPLFLKLIKYLFILDSPIGGIVIYESARTTYPNYSNPNQSKSAIIQTKWLSGCNMSYRRKVVNEFLFNEAFSCTYDPDGYRFVGEDVEYSHRVGKKYLLVMNPNAKLLHAGREKKTDKPILIYHLRDLYRSKRYWLENHIKWTPFRELLFWWAFVGLFFVSILDALVDYSGWVE